MINSRSIDDLTPDAQIWLARFKAHAEAEGLVYLRFWIVTSTYRDQEYQDRLYAQGRTAPGPIVTWTRYSSHTSRRAWDVAIRDPKTGKINWSVVKTDVDQDQIPDYEELASVGRTLGLKVGADYGDYAHFETPEVVG
jgi:hypothetical protein